jgi:hypothetical protein
VQKQRLQVEACVQRWAAAAAALKVKPDEQKHHREAGNCLMETMLDGEQSHTLAATCLQCSVGCRNGSNPH